MLPKCTPHGNQIDGNTASTTTSSVSSSFVDKMECTENEASDDDDTDAINRIKARKLDTDDKMDVSPDEIESIDTESSPDSLDNAINLAKIKNLELFPVEILEIVFNGVDDADLFNLTDTCTRLATVTQTMFSMRYSNGNFVLLNGKRLGGDHFVVNGERLGGDPDIYAKQLNRFDHRIHAIQINHAENIDGNDNNWASNLLRPITQHIKKLTFNNCIFKSNNIFAQKLDNLTHLAYKNDFIFNGAGYEIDFPECHKLEKLEVHTTYEQLFSANSLYRTIRNNPSLHRLLLYNFPVDDMSFWQILTLIAEHTKQLKELALVMRSDWEWEAAPYSIDRIIESFGHLESLALSIGVNTIEHLKRFGTKCKRINHLGLRIHHGRSFDLQNELVDVARSFQQIESFYYYRDYLDGLDSEIEAMVEKFSKLRELNLKVTGGRYPELPNVLSLFKKCPTLEKVTIDFIYKFNGRPATFVSSQFFEKFIETMNITGKTNAQIEVKERGQIIGSVTKNGTIWRNMLMHWIDCERNDTNTSLLDLANYPVDSEKSKRAADQINLLDRIFEYLDLSSFTALVKTGERSKRLVDNYIKKQMKKFGTFSITDEFRSYGSYHFWTGLDRLNYVDYITDLTVCALHQESKRHILDFFEDFWYYVDKLSIYDEFPEEPWPDKLQFISHVVYNSSHFLGYSELVQIIKQFPDAEIIEFKRAGVFNDFNSGGKKFPECRKLKEFVFNYFSQTQMANLKEIFKSTKTKLVPVFPNSIDDTIKKVAQPKSQANDNDKMDVTSDQNETTNVVQAEVDNSECLAIVINGERMGGDSGNYPVQLKQFDGHIQLNHVKNIDANHITAKLLQSHINEIKKLTFDSCTFKSVNIFSDPPDGIENLVIRHHCCDPHKQLRSNNCLRMIDLPECHNLTKLELHGADRQFLSKESFVQLLRVNPTLQSLLLYDFPDFGMGLYEMLTSIAEHLNGIKELALIMDNEWKADVEPMANSDIFQSFKHLESLALSCDRNAIEILRRFATECQSIKSVGLRTLFGEDIDYKRVLVDIIKSFKQVESFQYYQSFDHDLVNYVECSDVLPLIRECPTLQKITMVFKYSCREYPWDYISASFFKKFIRAKFFKPNACIEIQNCGKIIASVTANGIRWRNKLMHWPDCDKNNTKIHLLDLADHPIDSEKTKRIANQTNLFDRICEYLDLGSLCSLAETNNKSEKLVNNYVKKYSKKHGKFTISDEFESFEWNADCSDIFETLKFAQFITDLNVHTFDYDSKDHIAYYIQNMVFLDKVTIYDEHPEERWPIILSGLPHVIYDSSHFMDYSELIHIIEQFPDAETIEFKRAGVFNDFRSSGEGQAPKCNKLKEFLFNYHGETQMANLEEIFKNTDIKLVPVFPNLA